jgi:hypothetical protein
MLFIDVSVRAEIIGESFCESFSAHDSEEQMQRVPRGIPILH